LAAEPGVTPLRTNDPLSPAKIFCRVPTGTAREREIGDPLPTTTQLQQAEESVMTRITNIAARAAAGLVALALVSNQAFAVSAAVESACASDYFAYCSKHDPNGAGVRRCMRANGLRLSATCIDALIAAGEVSKAEVQRRGRAAGRL
jgi:hypothetical protein